MTSLAKRTSCYKINTEICDEKKNHSPGRGTHKLHTLEYVSCKIPCEKRRNTVNMEFCKHKINNTTSLLLVRHGIPAHPRRFFSLSSPRADTIVVEPCLRNDINTGGEMTHGERQQQSWSTDLVKFSSMACFILCYLQKWMLRTNLNIRIRII